MLPCRVTGRVSGLLLVLSALLSLAACSSPPESHVLQGQALGTYWSVRMVMPEQARATEGLRSEIEDALELVDRQMSTWREDSDLSRFNQLEAGQSMEIPEAFAHVLETALDIAELSDGHFDPTIGPLVNLWGFGPEGRRSEPPPEDEIEQALQRVDWRRLDYDPDTRRLTQPGDAYLDFSGIAKGFAAELVAERLMERGIEHFIVDLGGDMVVRGQRPDGTPWRIAIERPEPDTRDIFSVIEVRDRALVTSGSYRNYFEYGETSFSHTIDPHIGRPIPEELVSVTVVHDDCTVADALATAITAMGADEGYRFARENELAALLLVIDGDSVAERMTEAFAGYLPQEEY
ncbi:FAD:protein FMN transferase [Wenzhouxiangella sp. AB-CW3]|uniref:FAD:protein FMN transferase n=1 Tax=Wenzhouxiangella sp. AB-CW3 TaxID=2771012 RepID=UPI00168A8AE8|nr:FAD:protein FMN transferase [Wenzhouxiangella sp. AB-CW3]QOC21395.1 FAD:protein FMN transferase [Wenzhouxiangella sp. AB-CW3]